MLFLGLAYCAAENLSPPHLEPALNKKLNRPAALFFHRTPSMASSSSNVVGVHYRVGKKIGEGSFGVIFEGTNLLNNQQVAIKFVCYLEILDRLAC